MGDSGWASGGEGSQAKFGAQNGTEGSGREPAPAIVGQQRRDRRCHSPDDPEPHVFRTVGVAGGGSALVTTRFALLRP